MFNTESEIQAKDIEASFREEEKRVYRMVEYALQRREFQSEYIQAVSELVEESQDDPKFDYISRRYDSHKVKIYRKKNKYEVYQCGGFMDFDLKTPDYMTDICGEHLSDVKTIEEMPRSVTARQMVECMVDIMLENDTHWCEVCNESDSDDE